MKNMNYDRNIDQPKRGKTFTEHITKLLTKAGVDDDECAVLFSYEPKIPSEIITQHKDKVTD